MAKTKSKKTKKITKRGNVFYIMSPQCGWCKKADPIVKELTDGGYKITTIDATKPEGQQQSNEIKQKWGIQCGTPLFVEEKTGQNVCGFREKEILSKWLDGEELPAPPTPKSPMPRPPFLNADEGEVNDWKENYNKWSEENKHLPGLKSAEELLSMPRPKSQPPQPPNSNMNDNELEMWSLEWDEWAMQNNHLPGIQMSEQLLARFKPQWESQAKMLADQNEKNGVKLPDSGLYYFFSPQCAFCTETSKEVTKLVKEGKKITKKDTSIKEDKAFQSAILHKYNIQCGTPMLVDLSNGNYLCGAHNETAIQDWANGKKNNPFPPVPPKADATDEQISNWVDRYNEYIKVNDKKNLPSADEYMKSFLNRRRVVSEHKKLLNAGNPTGPENNPNITTRTISGEDAVGMTTHSEAPRFNKRWYYHVMEPGKKTMVHADAKYLADMKYQYLHREGDGTYTKVIGDQWLQNDLLQKHKQFKDDKEAMNLQKQQQQENLTKKTVAEVQQIAEKSKIDSKKILTASEKAKIRNQKNKLTKKVTETSKEFSDDVKNAIADLKSDKDTSKNIPGF